jgi:hypothetical protein
MAQEERERNQERRNQEKEDIEKSRLRAEAIIPILDARKKMKEQGTNDKDIDNLMSLNI